MGSLGLLPPIGKPQVPPLRSPRFPVELGGVGKFHAPFSTERPHTWPLGLPLGRKSGYAPVPRHAGAGGMTKGRVGLPVEIGLRDPRSQKRDLGHPSVFTLRDIGLGWVSA
jgi:hypothetical protein